MKYLLDRLKEPGTLRSLAVVLFALLGIVPDDALLQSVVSVAILALGGWSALMPEKGAQAVEKIQEAATEVRQATQDAKAATTNAKGVVQQAIGRTIRAVQP